MDPAGRSRGFEMVRRRFWTFVAATVVASGVVAAGGPPVFGQEPPPPAGEPEVVEPAPGGGDQAAVLQDAVVASESGHARVVVTTAPGTDVDAVHAALAGSDSTVLSELTSVPAAVAEVDAAGLEALLADPSVQTVNLDRAGGLALDVSTGIIDSDRLNAAGVLGNGYEGARGGRYEVVVVDTGVDRQHRAFTGRIISEACFSIGAWCPNHQQQQVGRGAGAECTWSPDCIHGTHVAGTAAGAWYRGGHEGVARGAGIVSIQVGNRAPCGTGFCWQFFTSDLDRAFDHVLRLVNRGRKIASINLSLGTFALFSSAASCASAFPVTHQLTTRLARAGVAVVAAAGNSFSRGPLSAPACLPNVYAVSASDDFDQPADFSNRGTMTDFWAPGVFIVAPVPGRTAKASLSGTSMASPHVAGAFALLRECPGNGGAGAVAKDLRATGRRLNIDGVRRRRINVLQAAVRNVSNNTFGRAIALPRTGSVNRRGSNTCADRERGEPGPNTIENSVWFTWRPRAGGRVVISTNNGGGHRTTFDTELSVFTGGRLAALRLVAHDNNSGAGTRSQVAFRAQAGTTYRIRIDGRNATNGWYNLHLHRP
jgi:subtilisin family serine protease